MPARIKVAHPLDRYRPQARPFQKIKLLVLVSIINTVIVENKFGPGHTFSKFLKILNKLMKTILMHGQRCFKMYMLFQDVNRGEILW